MSERSDLRALLAEVEESHFADTGGAYPGCCATCFESWPCLPSRLASAVREMEKALTRLEVNAPQGVVIDCTDDGQLRVEIGSRDDGEAHRLGFGDDLPAAIDSALSSSTGAPKDG